MHLGRSSNAKNAENAKTPKRAKCYQQTERRTQRVVASRVRICGYSSLIKVVRGSHEESFLRVGVEAMMKKTRPDTWLPKSRVGRPGQ